MSVLYAARRALSHHVEETPIDPRAQKSRESLIRVMVNALDEDPQPPSVSAMVETTTDFLAAATGHKAA